MGVALGYSLLGLVSLKRGIAKLEVSADPINEDLEASWEVLGEAVQTMMRRYGVPEPYEKLKAMTRGQQLGPEALRNFIRALEIPDHAKERLVSLTPATYTGYAAELADGIAKINKAVLSGNDPTHSRASVSRSVLAEKTATLPTSTATI